MLLQFNGLLNDADQFRVVGVVCIPFKLWKLIVLRLEQRASVGLPSYPRN